MNTLSMVLVCAGVTCLLRALPFVCFRGGVPPLIDRLGRLLPPAIMAALVVYCLRSVPFGAGADGLCQLAAAAVVVAVHLLRRSTLLSIAAGTAAYMLLIRVIPPSIPL